MGHARATTLVELFRPVILVGPVGRPAPHLGPVGPVRPVRHARPAGPVRLARPAGSDPEKWPTL
eukprot:537902-Pyramimonas_sp.AAC.1